MFNKNTLGNTQVIWQKKEPYHNQAYRYILVEQRVFSFAAQIYTYLINQTFKKKIDELVWWVSISCSSNFVLLI